MVILIALCIPITAFVTGFFTLKGVQLGLGLKAEKPKEMKPNVEPIKNEKPPDNNKTVFAEMMNEWLYGEKVGE